MPNSLRSIGRGLSLYLAAHSSGGESYFREVMPILKLLLGGSPCTFWSIAQTKHRETEPSGIGWELFKNYLIALEKYRQDYFLIRKERV